MTQLQHTGDQKQLELIFNAKLGRDTAGLVKQQIGSSECVLN